MIDEMNRSLRLFGEKRSLEASVLCPAFQGHPSNLSAELPSILVCLEGPSPKLRDELRNESNEALNACEQHIKDFMKYACEDALDVTGKYSDI